MKKKIMMILCASLMVCSLTACGGENGQASAEVGTSKVESDATDTKHEEKKKEIKDEDITMDELRTRKPNAESDFEAHSNGDGTCTVYSYEGTSSVIVVPETINGDRVISFHVYAFANNDKITAVRFPDTAEKLGDGVCGNDTSLKYVICGAGTKEIGEGAFNNTAMEELELNDGLEKIKGVLVSSFIEGWTIEITIPESVTYVRDFGGNGVSVRVKAGSVSEQVANDYNYKYVTY